MRSVWRDDVETRLRLDAAMASGLRPACGVLAALFVFFAGLHVALLTGTAAVVMTALGLATAAASAAMGALAGRGRLPTGWAHRVGAGLALLVLVNIFVQYALTGDPQLRMDVVLALTGFGVCLVDVRWVAGLLSAGVVGWVLTVALSHPEGGDWPKTLPDLVTAVALAAMANVLRQRSLRQLLATEQQLRRLVDGDELTGLLNRRGFLAHARTLIDGAPAPVAVWFFDVNDLKIVNDAYGHAAGDEALAAVARVLTAEFGEPAVVGRLSGDEFAVAAVAAPQAESACRLSVAEHVAREGERIRLPLSVSIGYAEAQPMQDLSSVLEAADTSMYVAKAAHRTVPAALPVKADRPTEP